MPMRVEDLKKKLLARIEKHKHEFATRTMHLLEKPLPAGTRLQIGPHRHDVGTDAFLVVIDEAPGAFWTHPVHYELHDVNSGEIHVISEKYPLEVPDVQNELIPLHIPDLPHLKQKKDDFFELRQLKLAELERDIQKFSFGPPSPQTNKRHALFIAGMDNMPHFHNDFVIMRDILIERYGYDPANIVIAMGDGSGYADLPVNHAGDKAGIDAALDAFASGGAHALDTDDSLFLYTFNHGDFDGTHSSLCLPGWGNYYDYQLKTKIDNIHCRQLIVAMNQCCAGGFIDDLTATTGPSEVAVMTASRSDQSAYASSGSDHGYFSVVLATALNWAFPSGIPTTFPGYTGGSVVNQDSNSDGLVCAEEAFHYVQTMMAANHLATINGWETPQWGVSAPGLGATLFWGLPELVVEDGNPWFESPDVFLHDPAVVPDDITAAPNNPANWSDYYHPDTVNRIVARVHNRGCAPARNISVEFRNTSTGAGGGTVLAGIGTLADVNPGHHDFAYVDWNFSSALLHRCTMVRASCAGDAAEPYGDIIGDPHQAQRNLDPLFAAPSEKKQFIERKFLLRNPLKDKLVFALTPLKEQTHLTKVTHVLPEAEKLQHLSLEPGKGKEVTIRFEIPANAELGEKIRFPFEFRGTAGGPRIGGITFTIEIAEGRLEGKLVHLEHAVAPKGKVSIENIKQPQFRYEVPVSSRGTFSFRSIAPGPYRIHADCGSLVADGSVFVNPNRITTKLLRLESRQVLVPELPKVKEAVAA